jgi:glycosyltransferase involved in cell wall biosynthesis
MKYNILDKSICSEWLVSIVIPVYNEVSAIEKTVTEVNTDLIKAGIMHEIIVIDDGSADGTYKVLQSLSQQFHNLKAVRFSRNFGKEAALLAGLKAAVGDAVVTMDGDLQHPPAMIPVLVEKWRQGYKVVHAVKESRNCDSRIVRWRAFLFNSIFNTLGGMDLKGSSDFILMDRMAKDIIVNHLPERMRFYRGLAHWIGFDQAIVYFKVAERKDESQSKWSMVMLFNLATTALVSFSGTPLRIITVLGLLVLLLGLVIGLDALISWYSGTAISGFATTIGTILIIGSFIMISLGIIGEYLARIYEELKARPISVIQDFFGFDRHPDEKLSGQGHHTQMPTSTETMQKTG